MAWWGLNLHSMHFYTCSVTQAQSTPELLHSLAGVTAAHRHQGPPQPGGCHGATCRPTLYLCSCTALQVWQLRTDIGGLRNQVVVMEQQRAELEARAAADAAAHASLQVGLCCICPHRLLCRFNCDLLQRKGMR
eukprot:scaffold284078_cov19-Tisochrysis_lutea.AAC.1